MISHGGSYAAISGLHGLSVLELPTRWGSDGIYHDGKLKVTCKTNNIHEHSENQLELIQIRWHPNSPTDSYLIALFSDNSLRMYDDGNLKHVWRVGPLPSQSIAAKTFSYIRSLGDTAIDFDIAPAQISNNHDNHQSLNNSTIENTLSTSLSISRRQELRKVEWPFIILRGNGTIYVLCASLNTEKPRLQGPLIMMPSQKDNYGDDSCSMLVIPTFPVTIVIAENSGILHHVLLIEKCYENSHLDDTNTILRNDWDLFVLENIELELGLEEDDKDISHLPLYLKKDPINEHRYYCYHDAGLCLIYIALINLTTLIIFQGLHGITLGFIQQLQKFIEETEDNFDANIPSRAEYILSTKAFNNSKTNAVCGMGILQLPSGVFVIMSSGQIVSLSTVKTLIPMHSCGVNSQVPNIDQMVIDQQLKIPFDRHIKLLLKTEISQPILQLDKKNPPSSKQTFQLLMNSIQIMRDKQFVKHDKVRQDIMKRIKILELMKNQQKDEIATLLESKEGIQEKAYRLADMHEEIMERQQKIQIRINENARLASLKMPSNATNENEFVEKIKRMHCVVNKLNQDVKQIKAKHEVQKKSLEKWNKLSEDTTLPPKQEETIKEFLSDMMRQIHSLKADVHKIHNVIDY